MLIIYLSAIFEISKVLQNTVKYIERLLLIVLYYNLTNETISFKR